MESVHDDWEDLRISTFCDASFSNRCVSGFKIKLSGSKSSSFLIVKAITRTTEHEFYQSRDK